MLLISYSQFCDKWEKIENYSSIDFSKVSQMNWHDRWHQVKMKCSEGRRKKKMRIEWMEVIVILSSPFSYTYKSETSVEFLVGMRLVYITPSILWLTIQLVAAHIFNWIFCWFFFFFCLPRKRNEIFFRADQLHPLYTGCFLRHI